MHDKKAIVVGLTTFVTVASAPFWLSQTTATNVKVHLDPPPNGAQFCVEDTKNGAMRAKHPRILEEWRTAVVRDGDRSTFTVDRKEYQRSLQKTCLSCHENKEAFCDRCHTATGVSPNCFGCHGGKNRE